MSRRYARLRAVSPVGPGGRRVVESAGFEASAQAAGEPVRRPPQRVVALGPAGPQPSHPPPTPRISSPVPATQPPQRPAGQPPATQRNRAHASTQPRHPSSGQLPRPPPRARSFASAQSPRATSAHPPTATRRPVRRTADPLTLIRRLGGPWAWPLSARAAYMPTGSADAHIPPRPRAWPSAAPTAPVALRWRTRTVRSWHRPFTDTVLLARGEGGYAVIDESCRARSTSRRAIPASRGHRPRRNGCCLAGP